MDRFRVFGRIIFILVGLVGFSVNVVAQYELKTQMTRKKDLENDTIVSPYLYINNIHILGNKKTKSSIITRELSFSKGDSIMSHWLERFKSEDRTKIYNTNLFNTVEFTVLELDSVNRDIIINVTERWYLYPRVFFKLSDRNFNEWWTNRNHNLNRVNFGGGLYKYNVGGQNQTIRWVSQFGFENLQTFEYEIPYIEKTQRHGLVFGVGYAENKNLFYQTTDHVQDPLNQRELLLRRAASISVSHRYRKSFYFRQYISLLFKTTSINDTIVALNDHYFNDGNDRQRYIGVGYSFARDFRNNHSYPLRGDFLYGRIQQDGIGIFDDLYRTRISLGYDRFVELKKGFFFSTENYGIYSSRNVPYYNYQRLGDVNNLVRGFELNVIEGPIYGLSRNSLKKRLFKSAYDISKVMPLKQFQRLPIAFYGVTFFDAAYVHGYPNHPTSTRLSDKLIYGMGLGLDFVTIHDLSWKCGYSLTSEGELHFFLNIRQDL